MAGNLQPLDEKFPIVGPDGRPTLYFIQWCQQRQIDITEAITLLGLENYLDTHPLQEGSGIQITPSGSLKDSPTIEADAQEILDQITTTRGSILYRNASDWVALPPGTAGQVLQTNGAGADPAWAGAGGGGALTLISEVVTAGLATNVQFAAIPGTYRDLELRVRGRGNNASNLVSVRMQFNNDTGNNYDHEDQQANNATNTNFPLIAQPSAYLGNIVAGLGTAGYGDMCDVVIGDYRGTTFQKPFRALNGTRASTTPATYFNDYITGWWRSTVAITEIDVFLSTGAFANNSVVSLYGRL